MSEASGVQVYAPLAPEVVRVDTVWRLLGSPRLRMSVTGSLLPCQVMVAGWPTVNDCGIEVMAMPAWAATVEAKAARPKKRVLMGCMVAAAVDVDDGGLSIRVDDGRG